MTDLKHILSVYHVDTLRAMARQQGLEVTTRKKAALVQRVAKALGQPEMVKRAMSDLTPVERQALALIQAAGGEVSSMGLKQTLLRSGVIKSTPQGKNTWASGYYIQWYEGNPNYRGTPCYEDLMGRLALRGLALSREPLRQDRKLIEWTPGAVVFIPEAVAQHLPQLMAEGGEDGGKTVKPPQVLAGSARAFQRDLGRYWRYIRSKGELRLTTQGYVYKADLKAINETLGVVADLGPGQGEADNGRLYFIRRLLPELGVVQVNRQTGNLEPVSDADFWKRSPAERVKQTFQVWRDGTGWNELLQLPTRTRGYHHSRPAPAHLKQVRGKILKYIREMNAGCWIDVNHLIDQVRLRDYGFLFANRRPQAHSYYGYSSYYAAYSTPYHESNNSFGITFEGIKSESEGWDKVEAELIAHIVGGPLYWMGLVDLGYPADAQPDPNNAPRPHAYRLTELGAWLLGLAKAVEIPEEGGRIVVQPNFQILAMEPISDQVLITLDRFAEPEGGDRVMSYKLTRQSVYRGQRDEWSVPRIIEYLEKLSGTPLPGNVRRSLEEWQTLHERIVFRRGITVAQAANAETLDRLLADPELAQALGRRVTENVTLAPGSVSTTAEALRRRGWLPLITPAAQRQAPDSLRADREGRLRFVHAAPSIYALGRVAPFSETENGSQRITHKAVRAALKTMTVDEILAALRSVHAGELPRELVIDIKAWGKYYGDARMDTLTLIEFRDHHALEELAADPDLAAYLEPFEAGSRALAAVDRRHLDAVQALLAERGIEVRWGLG